MTSCRKVFEILHKLNVCACVKQFSDKQKFDGHSGSNAKRFNSDSGSLNFKRQSHPYRPWRGRGWNYLAKSGIKRALLPVLFALEVFFGLDRRKLIRVYCDNTTAVTYINNMGGMILSLDPSSTQI